MKGGDKMKNKFLEKIQFIVWVLGFVAVALLVYGIIRTLLA